MLSPRKGSPRRPCARRWALCAGLSIGGLLPATGCQVDMAGMTLPSGKYMYDDVQYFPPGPEFPWANTHAATQRARMAAAGMPLPGAGVLPGQPGAAPVLGPPIPPGTLEPTQNLQGRPTNVNVMPSPAPAPGNLAPGAIPAPPVPVPGGVVEPSNESFGPAAPVAPDLGPL